MPNGIIDQSQSMGAGMGDEHVMKKFEIVITFQPNRKSSTSSFKKIKIIILR